MSFEFHIRRVINLADPYGQIAPGLVCGAIELKRFSQGSQSVLIVTLFYAPIVCGRPRWGSIPWAWLAAECNQMYMATYRGLQAPPSADAVIRMTACPTCKVAPGERCSTVRSRDYVRVGNNILDESAGSGDDESEYDPIYHLSNAIFPDDVVLDESADRWMCMIGDFALYCDESYSHPPEPRVYTVAGYLSTSVQWIKFRREWRRILDSEGIDHFHMVDFQACKPPFDSWSKEKRVDFLRSLHAVIHARTIMSFATSADVEDFEHLAPEQKTALISPHVFAAKNCMKQVGFWAAENIINHPVIAYIFEEGQPHERQLNRLVGSLTDEDKWYFRMASLAFAPKKGVNGVNALQAADMVAYESMKDIARKVNPLNKRGARLSGLNLAGDPERNQWFYCGEYDLIGSIKNAEVRAKDYADRHEA